MSFKRQRTSSSQVHKQGPNFENRLAVYIAVSTATALTADQAHAVIVGNNTVRPIGINGEVNIDLNSDGQIDWQIDHDRVNLNGNNLDYLQFDKNDGNSATNPYPIDYFSFPPANSSQKRNEDHEYVTTAGPSDKGYYPKALLAGTEIGPLTETWESYQETDNFDNADLILRANRLIDEDASQIDQANPNPPPGQSSPPGTTPIAPFGTPGWVGLNGQTGYLGFRLDLNGAGQEGFNDSPDDYWYGWVGVKILNEQDATGEVVGWAYESTKGASINAGDFGTVAGDHNGDGDVNILDYAVWRQNPAAFGNEQGYNDWRANYEGAGTGASLSTAWQGHAVPEPSGLMLVAAGIAIVGSFLFGRFGRS